MFISISFRKIRSYQIKKKILVLIFLIGNSNQVYMYMHIPEETRETEFRNIGSVSEPVARGPRHGNIFSNSSIIYARSSTMWNRMRAGLGQTKKSRPAVRDGPGRQIRPAYNSADTLSNQLCCTHARVRKCCAG